RDARAPAAGPGADAAPARSATAGDEGDRAGRAHSPSRGRARGRAPSAGVTARRRTRGPFAPPSSLGPDAVPAPDLLADRRGVRRDRGRTRDRGATDAARADRELADRQLGIALAGGRRMATSR